MFDVTTGEFLLIALVALIAVGPKRLAEMSRQIGRFVGRLRVETERFKHGIEQEISEITAPAQELSAEARQAGEELQEAARAAKNELVEALGQARDSLEELGGLRPIPRRRPVDRRQV